MHRKAKAHYVALDLYVYFKSFSNLVVCLIKVRSNAAFFIKLRTNASAQTRIFFPVCILQRT